MTSGDDVPALFHALQHERWLTSRTTAGERRERLRGLRAAVLRHADAAADALHADLSKPRERPVMREVARMLGYLDDAIDRLPEWMREDRLPDGPDGTRAYVRYEARGVCLLLGPWNFPYQLTLGPLVPIIAAGNVALIKPNELTPATSAVIADIVREALPPEQAVVVEGGIDLAERLLELPVDHIFFTGSPAIGRVVMTAAAKHLASVTLELGGKCPAVVDRSTDVALAASQIARGKHHNSGQVCLAPDHVWVHEDVRDEFVHHYLEWIAAHLYDEHGKLDESKCSRIVDDRNLLRLEGYLGDALTRGARARTAGAASTTRGFVTPTVLQDVPLDADVMTEEVFGPILPVLTWSSRAALMAQLQATAKPLAIYVFTGERVWAQELIEQTSSGGVTVNGWATHSFDARLPFGGVGASGMGRYQGVHGFRELSHARAVVEHPEPAYGVLVTDG